MFITNIFYAQDLEINLCDEDGNGYASFNIEEIENYVIENIGEKNDDFQEQVLISTSEGNILRINSPSSNPNLTFLCKYDYPIGDIAVNLDKEIFICAGNFIKVDDNCLFSFYPADGWQVNSLSFDNLGLLYYGFGNESDVRRIDIESGAYSGEIWHDFQRGTSAGDFVLLNGKIYVAWKLTNDNYRLYEVTIDNKNNYVSHVDLGQIPNKTFGLASELGKLYGVTIDKLYEIDLDTFTFTDIIQNSNPEDQWYGAAGLHEAIVFNTSTHLTSSDAVNNLNSLNGDWTNTISGGQTIYVRIENSLTGEYDIVQLLINITTYPKVNLPLDLVKCYGDTYNIFDLTQVSTQMKINLNDNLTFTYYRIDPEININANPIPAQYQSLANMETLYVSVEKNNSGCNLTYSFEIINSKNPNLLPISDIQSPTILESCYFDKNSVGYFNLKDIEKDIIFDDGNFEKSYYLSYLDAENNNNEISHIYYSNYPIQEVFIKVTDEQGCYTISNFYLNIDCYTNNASIANIIFPKFITPNNDGKNDFWNITGVSEKVKKESTITIHDRYGKMLFSFNPYSSIGWDGTFNGNQLPASDYWFVFKTDSGLKKIGHLALKR
jgi:gliding motility-associated-like protein